QPAAPRTRAGLTAAGARLFELVVTGAAAAQIVAFTPIARRMGAYLVGSYEPEPGVPTLEQLAEWSSRGWGLPQESGPDGGCAMRWRAALDGNLLGPVAAALALSPGFEWAKEPMRRPSFGISEARRV